MKISDLAAAYDAEYATKEVDFDNEADFYVETHSVIPLKDVSAATLTPSSLLKLIKTKAIWFGDDAYMDLANLFDYAFARGLLPRGVNPAQVAYSRLGK